MDEEHVSSNGTCVSSLVFHHRLCFPTPPGLYYFFVVIVSLSLSLSDLFTILLSLPLPTYLPPPHLLCLSHVCAHSIYIYKYNKEIDGRSRRW
jgi:hypothetical protein